MTVANDFYFFFMAIINAKETPITKEGSINIVGIRNRAVRKMF